MQNDILFNIEGSLGVITINRPKALNALNYEISKDLADQLRQWAPDDRVQAVWIEGAGGKALSAGGDIRQMYDMKQKDGRVNVDFFRVEYELNHQIATYPKPVIAIMQGVVMGGGCGISIHTSHRIVSDNTKLAMPETGIGLFPDIGAAYFLNQIPGAVGMFLALTGTILNAADSLYVGLADFYKTENDINSLKKQLIADISGISALNKNKDLSKESNLKTQEDKINTYFSNSNIEELIQKLNQSTDPWAQAQSAILAQKSPTSLCVTFDHMRWARDKKLPEILNRDFHLACHFMQSHDFFEGVRAALVDKDKNPRWSPATIADVSPAIRQHYAAPSDQPDLSIL